MGLACSDSEGAPDSPVGRTEALQQSEAFDEIANSAPLSVVVKGNTINDLIVVTVPSKQTVDYLIDCTMAQLHIGVEFRSQLSFEFSGAALPPSSKLDQHGLCENAELELVGIGDVNRELARRTQAMKEERALVTKALRANIFVAARNNEPDRITLIGQHANEKINSRDKDGWTPLGLAIQRGHLEAVEALLYAGADANEVVEETLFTDGSRRRCHWKTPLRNAMSRGYQEIVDVLRVFGAEN